MIGYRIWQQRRQYAAALTPLALVAAVFAAAGLGPESPTTQPIETRWDYPDPLVSTTPTNWTPEDRRSRRPERTDAEYSAVAEYLRKAYAQDPANWPEPHLDEGIAHRPLGLPPEEAHPDSNPYSREKARLGKLLFFDGRLSSSGQMSCNSCHVAELGWADGRSRSLGHGADQLTRNTPTMLNSGMQPHQFWDGRSETLEQLVNDVLSNETEMRTTPREAARRIAEVPGYAEHFEKAFGDPAVTPERIAMAIACHVRTIHSDGSSDFDWFLKGRHDRMSDQAIRGLHLFRTDARCINCHSGPLFRDDQFHNVGLSYYGRPFEDLGRYHVTKKAQDVGKFKTPTLRNVERTAPYFHVGFFDLNDVVNFYNAGGLSPKRPEKFADDPLWPETSKHLKPLHLNDQDLRDLIAFLEALTERAQRDIKPDLPE